MQVKREDVLKMAKMAKLEFNGVELEKITGSLNQLVEYMDILRGLDLQDVEPMLTVDDSPRPLREDVLGVSLNKEQVFRNAPEVNMDHFSIPKVIGG